MSMMATMKVAEAQLTQVVTDHSDLFPNSEYLENSDSDSMDFEEEEVFSMTAARSVGHILEEAVSAHITRRELVLHCRRRTRGVEETNRLIGSLIIMRTSASDAHFQAYLLEGLMRWNDDRMEDAVKGAPSIRSYGSALREAVDQLSQKVLGRCWDERYRTPGAYTGELLGMEYLYSQTGKELTPVLQNPEEEDRLVEEVNDEDFQDEGFVEESMEDVTVPVTASPPPPSPSQPSSPPPSSPPPSPPPPSPPQALYPCIPADEAQGAVIGPHWIAGWDKVQDLAVYLVGLVRLPTH
ncbi:hypothetical protein D5F01_LYC24890 [Larimichthys crocea]|uniref:Uncharacterized protein n=1 Tax=Larimichthys crocea TaxID=215358 RepID=A0A6G0HDZ0_LARCR|nr:hypothetical protein D5F01_LYC24890 [Larimichthys crocea]